MWVGASNNDPAQGLHALKPGPGLTGGGLSYDNARAYSKRVPRTNCALRIKKCAPRISSGICFHAQVN